MRFCDLIKESGYLHRPLPADHEYFTSRSLTQEILAKPVYEKVMLPLDQEHCQAFGRGTAKVKDNIVHLLAPVSFDHWGEGYPPDGDYCNFGQCGIQIKPLEENLSRFTRIYFEAYAEDCGVRTPHLYVGLKNDGAIKVPDIYNRTGTCVMQLNYGKWTPFVWEIEELPRDKVTAITITMSLNGKESSVFADASVKIRGICLETTSKAEPFEGWNCGNRIAYSYSGYRVDSKKVAFTQLPCENFTLYHVDSHQTFTFPSQKTTFNGADFYLLDFTAIDTQGNYQIIVGEQKTKEFPIDKTIFNDCTWKLLNFIYSERCGYPIPEKHGICHGDIVAKHNETTISYNGGWHDAGDLSQQTLQTGEIVSALYKAADKNAQDKQLRLRLYEEAEWGVAFLLKTRFGDGYRATSAGATRWTQGLIGDMDDVYARVHNHAFENFLLSAIECDASIHEREYDKGLADKLLHAAKEDFFFAQERYQTVGMELPIFFEHSYNSSPSLYDAAAVYAASMLLSVMDDDQIFDSLIVYLSRLLDSQEKGERGLPIKGWFYRDTKKEQPVHFNHQSREYLFAYALCSAATVLEKKAHPLKKQVDEAITLYADYYKTLAKLAAPQNMLPAGVFFESEAEDEETFRLLHLFADYQTEKENLKEQIRNGIKIADGVYIRFFPTWFSFRGNSAVMLSQATAVRSLADYLNDDALHAIANEQLYFICGKNPLCQSLIYGEGYRYPTLYAPLLGETVGEIPVGFETDGNKDLPFFPCANNATYKEVWTSPAARFLSAL